MALAVRRRLSNSPLSSVIRFLLAEEGKKLVKAGGLWHNPTALGEFTKKFAIVHPPPPCRGRG
jgi:hypothetical protein